MGKCELDMLCLFVCPKTYFQVTYCLPSSKPEGLWFRRTGVSRGMTPGHSRRNGNPA